MWPWPELSLLAVSHESVRHESADRAKDGGGKNGVGGPDSRREAEVPTAGGRDNRYRQGHKESLHARPIPV